MKILSVLVAVALVAGLTGLAVAGDTKAKSSGTGTSQPSATDTSKPSTSGSSSTESTQPSASPPTGTSTSEKPAKADDCKDDGWQKFGFKNQGECVAAVQPEKKQ
jgi:hypothetical protein